MTGLPGSTSTSSTDEMPASTSATGKIRAGGTAQPWADARNAAHASVSSDRSAGR